MFRWVSKFFASRVSPAEVASLGNALSETINKLTEVVKQVDRIERKVYRDLAKGDGGVDDVAAAFRTDVQAPDDIGKFGPGEQLPPGVSL